MVGGRGFESMGFDPPQRSQHFIDLTRDDDTDIEDSQLVALMGRLENEAERQFGRDGFALSKTCTCCGAPLDVGYRARTTEGLGALYYNMFHFGCLHLICWVCAQNVSGRATCTLCGFVRNRSQPLQSLTDEEFALEIEYLAADTILSGEDWMRRRTAMDLVADEVFVPGHLGGLPIPRGCAICETNERFQLPDRNRLGPNYEKTQTLLWQCRVSAYQL